MHCLNRQLASMPNLSSIAFRCLSFTEETHTPKVQPSLFKKLKSSIRGQKQDQNTEMENKLDWLLETSQCHSLQSLELSDKQKFREIAISQDHFCTLLTPHVGKNLIQLILNPIKPTFASQSHNLVVQSLDDGSLKERLGVLVTHQEITKLQIYILSLLN